MTGEFSIIKAGDLSKPANTLIEKIADAVGGYFKPFQIKRVAKAEAEAEKERREIARTEGTRLRQFLRNPFPYSFPKQGKYKENKNK